MLKGAYTAGKITEEERMDIVRNSCPGAGACGGMYTANTMASAIETLGMTLPYSSSTPAEDFLKTDECKLAGKAILELLEKDIKPSDIMSRTSFENAMVIVMALGGSTNAVLHLIAIARYIMEHSAVSTFDMVQPQKRNIYFLCCPSKLAMFFDCLGLLGLSSLLRTFKQ